MSCRDLDRLVTAFVDGELDPARASAIRGHARTCERCAAVVADEVAIRDSLAQAEPAEPPLELWGGIESRLIDAEIADARRPRLWLWWQAARPRVYAGALAAVTAVVAAVWLTGPRGDDPGRAAAAAARPDPATAAAPAAATAGEPPALLREVRAAEWAAAEARYRDAVAELRAILDEDRAAWAPAELAALEVRLAALDERVAQLRGAGAGPAAPDGGDELFAAYRAELALLQDAALSGGMP